MATIGELVDQGDILEERKDNVKKVLHDLGYAASRAVGNSLGRVSVAHPQWSALTLSKRGYGLCCH